MQHTSHVVRAMQVRPDPLIYTSLAAVQATGLRSLPVSGHVTGDRVFCRMRPLGVPPAWYTHSKSSSDAAAAGSLLDVPVEQLLLVRASLDQGSLHCHAYTTA